MIERISKKALERIPITQAAYQAGQSTTEHVLAVKMLAELATTSSNYTLHLLMLDMSKAFDTMEDKRGEEIVTDMGVPQDDCMSALLFIFYLAKALKLP